MTEQATPGTGLRLAYHLRKWVRLNIIVITLLLASVLNMYFRFESVQDFMGVALVFYAGAAVVSALLTWHILFFPRSTKAMFVNAVLPWVVFIVLLVASWLITLTPRAPLEWHVMNFSVIFFGLPLVVLYSLFVFLLTTLFHDGFKTLRFASVAGCIVVFVLFYELTAELYEAKLQRRVSYAAVFPETVCTELDLISVYPKGEWISHAQECYRTLAYHRCDASLCDDIDGEYTRSWCLQDIQTKQRRGDC